jgi:hypothetical protein
MRYPLLYFGFYMFALRTAVITSLHLLKQAKAIITDSIFVASNNSSLIAVSIVACFIKEQSVAYTRSFFLLLYVYKVQFNLFNIHHS